MVKISWYSSLGAKLFFLVTICLTGTVALISWQNGRLFGRYLDAQISGHAVDEARASAQAITSVLDGWRAQTSIAVHSITSEPDAARRGALARLFLSANRELVGIGVYRGSKEIAFAAIAPKDDLRFEDQSPKQTAKTLQKVSASWSASLAKKAADAPAMQPRHLKKETKLPLMALAMPFEQEGTVGVIWAILIVWQERVASSLPAGEQVRAALLDAAGATLVSAFPNGDRAAALAEHLKLRAIATRLGAPFGFSALADSKNLPRSGAFAKLGRYDLLVTSSRDARPSERTINKIIFQTAIWAWVIFLGSIFISYVSVNGVTRSLKRVTEATLRIASGDFSTQLIPKSRDEVGALSLAVNHMSDRIVKLLDRAVAAARQEKELETAKAVQELLYPPHDIVDEGIKIRGRYQVASECGGDWWWHYKTRSGKHIIIIADVTGHGAPAALVTAMAYSCCTTIREQVTSSDENPIAGFMNNMNQTLWIAGSGKTTMTALVMLLDPMTEELAYASAGHTMPYYLPATPDEVTFSGQPKKVKVLRCSGTPLGHLQHAEFEIRTLKLHRGDKILLYTDGLIECTNKAGKRWSKRLFETLMTEAAGHGAPGLVDAVVETALKHFAGHPIDDDVTVVGIELMRPQSAVFAT
jgi:serine phosphatase RsbU (regulator of sigma subunit)